MAINQFVQFQSLVYSYNNSALFIGADKVETPDRLINQCVLAFNQIHDDIVGAIKRKSWGYMERCCEDSVTLYKLMTTLGIKDDVYAILKTQRS
jgi:hypothetical protein